MAIGIVGISAELKPEEHLFLVGQVTDHTPQWKRKRLDECWRREDSFILCKFGLLLHIDDLEIVGARELFVAYAAKVRDCSGRARARACHKEPKQVLGQNSSGDVRETRQRAWRVRRLSSPARRKGCIS